MSDEATPDSGTIHIDAGEDHSALTFDSAQKLKTWLDEEVETWSWLKNPPDFRGGANLPARLSNARDQVVNALHQSGDGSARNDAIRRATDEIRELFGGDSPEGFLPSDPHRHLVLRIRAEMNDQVASVVHQELLRPGSVSAQRAEHFGPVTRGIAHAAAYLQRPFQLDAPESEAALKEAHKELERFSGAAQRDFAAFSDAFQQLSREIRREKALHANGFSEFIAEAKNDIETLKRTYETELQLQEPVSYWSKKVTGHRRTAFAAAVGFGGFSLFALWALSEELRWLGILADPRAVIGAEGWPWQLALLLGTASFLIWPLRIIARLFLSQLHMAADAAQRVTLANTYLALLQKDGGLRDEDRKLMLAELFRPAATGVVKEDAAPLNVAQWLSRRAGGE